MSDSYAVVQTDGDPPKPEVLAQALLGVPGLTPYDAKTRCNDAQGIISRGLTHEQASVFHKNLERAGVQVQTVPESELPVLPDGKLIRQVEFTPEALVIVDLLGRRHPVEWNQIGIIAAGSVQLTTFSRERQQSEDFRPRALHFGAGAIPMLMDDSGPVFTSKESTDWFLRAEIILADGSTRYNFEAEKLMFACLGERMTKNPAGNFCLFVRELVTRASAASLNTGAVAILNEPPEFIYYPRKGTFFEEMIWMLWRLNEGQES